MSLLSKLPIEENCQLKMAKYSQHSCKAYYSQHSATPRASKPSLALVLRKLSHFALAFSSIVVESKLIVGYSNFVDNYYFCILQAPKFFVHFFHKALLPI